MAHVSFTVPGPVAATRHRAADVRRELDDAIRGSLAGDTIEIDLRDVEAMTVSFADELIGKLLSERMEGHWVDRRIIVSGQSDEVRETVEAALERRKVSGIYRDASGAHGHALAAPPWFEATLLAAQKLGVFRAVEIADLLNITPQAVNNRLQRLMVSGALARQTVAPDGGGKEFEYRAS